MDDTYSYYATEDGYDEQLLQYWEEVSRDIAELSFVQRSEWFNAYLKSDIEKKLYSCFIVLLHGGKAIAIFPMQYGQLSRYGVSLNTWQILSPGELCLNDLIFNPAGNNQDVIAQLKKYLNTEQSLPWDILLLKYCRQGGAVDIAIVQHKPWRTVTIPENTSDYLICESEQNNGVVKLSSKFRRNIRRLAKKLRQQGEITIHMYRDAEQLTEAFEEFVEVESSGWKDKRQTSLLHDKKLQSFYRHLLEMFRKDGSCVIHTMKLDGRAIASQFSVITDDTYNMLKIGYDEKYKLLGPGAILLDETVRMFSNDDTINKISFVTGGGWQRKWSPEILYVANHYIYNGTMKGNFCYFMENSKDYLRSLKRYIKAKRQK